MYVSSVESRRRRHFSVAFISIINSLLCLLVPHLTNEHLAYYHFHSLFVGGLFLPSIHIHEQSSIAGENRTTLVEYNTSDDHVSSTYHNAASSAGMVDQVRLDQGHVLFQTNGKRLTTTHLTRCTCNSVCY